MTESRLYARITLDFVDSPKIVPLSDAAFRQYIQALLWSRRLLTDGFIPDGMVARLFTPEALAELTSNDRVNPSIKPVEGGYEIHDFAEHQTTRAVIEKKKLAGAKGGAAKTSSKTEAPASHLPEQNASKRLAKTETRSVQTLHYSPEFEEWWTIYPRKQGKSDAWDAYRDALKITDAATLKNGAQVYALSQIGTEKTYLKMPGGWLRKRRWEDEPVMSADSPRSAAQHLPSVPQPPRQDLTIYCRTHEGYPVPCAACERENLF